MILGSRSMVSRCRGVILGGRWVVSLSFVGDISDKAIVSIGVVLDMLDTSIRKVDRVRSFHVAGSVTCLASAEHRLGIVVGHRVVVRVGRDLVSVGRLGVVGGLCWSMAGGGSVVDMCRSMVGMCSFDYWSVVDLGWFVGGGSICRSWCMVSWSSGGVCRCRSSVGWCRGVRISRCWRMVGWGRRWCGVGVIGWGVVWGWSCGHSGNYAKKDLECFLLIFFHNLPI